MALKKKAELVAGEAAMDIQEISFGTVTFNLLGTSPLIVHRFSTKARQELLMPSRRKNAAERAQTLKHDPVKEFQECFYRTRGVKPQTFCHIPTGMISRAIADVAIDIPGATKSAIARLTSVTTPTLHLYGVPNLHMTMVRSSDINRTPDVRTRPIFEQWAIPGVTVKYMRGALTDKMVGNLLAAAGTLVGIGDWRPQRKGGSMGQFMLVPDNDKDLKELMKAGGYHAQKEAWEEPDCYDDETLELLQWFDAQVSERDIEPSASGKGEADENS